MTPDARSPIHKIPLHVILPLAFQIFFVLTTFLFVSTNRGRRVPEPGVVRPG